MIQLASQTMAIRLMTTIILLSINKVFMELDILLIICYYIQIFLGNIIYLVHKEDCRIQALLYDMHTKDLLGNSSGARVQQTRDIQLKGIRINFKIFTVLVLSKIQIRHQLKVVLAVCAVYFTIALSCKSLTAANP